MSSIDYTKLIADLQNGETAYTVPHALTTVDNITYVRGDYKADPKKHGTICVKLTRTASGFIAEIPSEYAENIGDRPFPAEWQPIQVTHLTVVDTPEV